MLFSRFFITLNDINGAHTTSQNWIINLHHHISHDAEATNGEPVVPPSNWCNVTLMRSLWVKNSLSLQLFSCLVAEWSLMGCATHSFRSAQRTLPGCEVMRKTLERCRWKKVRRHWDRVKKFSVEHRLIEIRLRVREDFQLGLSGLNENCFCFKNTSR